MFRFKLLCIKDGPNANAVSSGIVAGCVLGGTILILLIVLLGFLRYKQLKKIRNFFSL
jgi:hypothetical protein